MAHTNGSKRVESPRPEVHKALHATARPRPTNVETIEMVSDFVRKHPLATMVVGGLAGLGAIACIKRILR
jgi:hypothetical protein